MRRWIARVAMALVAVPLAWAVAALVAAFLPHPGHAPRPIDGITVFVISNGFHTDLFLPIAEAGVDLRGAFPLDRFANDASSATFLAFGWGERDFYMATPGLADFDVGLAIRALFGGGPTVIKVGNYLTPRPGADAVAITLGAGEYRSLLERLMAAFEVGPDGLPRRFAPGYGGHDAFFAARGRYSPFYTCNEWVADMLRAARVATPLWTPFAGPILRFAG